MAKKLDMKSTVTQHRPRGEKGLKNKAERSSPKVSLQKLSVSKTWGWKERAVQQRGRPGLSGAGGGGGDGGLQLGGREGLPKRQLQMAREVGNFASSGFQSPQLLKKLS